LGTLRFAQPTESHFLGHQMNSCTVSPRGNEEGEEMLSSYLDCYNAGVLASDYVRVSKEETLGLYKKCAKLLAPQRLFRV
jgi:hypothetical protein